MAPMIYSIAKEIKGSYSYLRKSTFPLRRGYLVLLLLFLGITFTPTTSAQVPNSIPKRLLIVHTHNIAYTRFFNISQSLMRELNNDKYLCQFDQLELNIKKDEAPEDIIKRFDPYLNDIHSGYYDAIVCIGFPAHNITTHLLPKASLHTPIFLLGLYESYPIDKEISLYPQLTGNEYQFDPSGTIELARTLFPKRTHFIVLDDTSPLSEPIREQLKNCLRKNEDMLFLEAENTSDAELIERIEEQKENTILLFINWNRPAESLVPYLTNIYRTLSIISDLAPTFVWRDTHFHYNVVGGVITETAESGRDAGKYIQDYFDSNVLMPLDYIPTKKVINWKALQKFSGSAANIPNQTTVLNKPFGFWDKHQTTILLVAGIVFFSLSLLLTLALLQNYRSRKRLQTTLHKAEKAERDKSTFLSIMSHEIRTPLNSIIGLAELVQDDTISSSQRREYIQNILLASHTLLTLINDILDLSKLEAGQMPIRRSLLDLSHAFKELYILFFQKVLEKNIQFLVHYSPDLPLLTVDANRLRQILLNLLSNSLKFTEHGSITLQAEWQKRDDATGTLIIQVIDTGIGISEEFLKKIFQPFAQEDQLDPTRTTQGTGLGMSISKHLAQAMDGDLTVQSKLGKGSTFTLQLNNVQYATATLADKAFLKPNLPNQELKPEARKLQILIVDDQAMNLMVLEKTLQRMGINPLVAQSGKKALEILKEKQVSLVLTDFHMPEMNGIQLATAIRSLPKGKDMKDMKDMKIYLLTADIYTDPKDISTSLDGVLVKPLTQDKLRNFLNTFV